eukprot:COSAG02_NODE_868_length_16360_cov_12.608204_2_plen_316_part_00
MLVDVSAEEKHTHVPALRPSNLPLSNHTRIQPGGCGWRREPPVLRSTLGCHIPAHLAPGRATRSKKQANRPPLPFRCREHGSEHIDSHQQGIRSLSHPTMRAELPYSVRSACHSGIRRASRQPPRPVLEDGAGAADHSVATGWSRSFAQSSRRFRSSDRGRSDPCSRHQHGRCGRFSCVSAPHSRSALPDSRNARVPLLDSIDFAGLLTKCEMTPVLVFCNAMTFKNAFLNRGQPHTRRRLVDPVIFVLCEATRPGIESQRRAWTHPRDRLSAVPVFLLASRQPQILDLQTPGLTRTSGRWTLSRGPGRWDMGWS